jgi:nucleoid-associated protein YgaU
MTSTKQVTVAGGTLFRLAANYLGDATQWNRIALATGRDVFDPWISGVVTVKIPPPDPRGGSGGILGPA